ncbi:aldo/keto reductase [Aeromicrobium sp. UC242_57]|uniref:aldo/keto reductase n=1 Tax=Aeromicrobium sp. UC242_57 TaxID=3374624 RepID=UPI003787ECC8
MPGAGSRHPAVLSVGVRVADRQVSARSGGPRGLQALGHRADRATADGRLGPDRQLEAFAAARDVSILELAIGGLAAQPAVSSVIAGATKPEQVVSNVAAASWVPTEDDLQALAEIGRPTQSYTTFAPRTAGTKSRS